MGTEIIIPNYQPPGRARGQRLRCRSWSGGSGVGDGQVIHMVQSGEGLFEIADFYGVSPNDITLANNLDNRNLLRVGQELIIPGVSLRDAARHVRALFMSCRPERACLGIAIRYGVTVEEVLEVNELTDPDSIFEGQELIIPGG